MIRFEDVIAEAQAQTGLSETGHPSALEALRVLVDATNNEARLSESGEQRWKASLVANLANRMKILDYLAKHPELLERPIEKPTFVFGLPRTGTTLTINLLHADPSRRCFLRWESQNPVPPAAAGALSSDPRYHATRAQGEMAMKYMPHITAIHFEEADSPSECQFSMSPSFTAEVFDSQAHIPSYRKWLFSTSYRATFEFQKMYLQLLQENNPGHWTLKNPWHPLFLDDLVAVYPDAQLVMTHRDPVEVVGSACSLLRHVRPIYSDQVSMQEIADTLLETFDLMIERQDAFRAQHGQDAIYDIHYAGQMRDPIGTMRGMYAHFDTPFTPEVEACMRRMLEHNPKGKFGKHEYSLAEFGLDAAQIHERYGDYCRRFGIPMSA